MATGSYRVLARSYRPTRISELIGQDALARTLKNAFASGRIAHAFLLCGIRGVGKTTTARIIARGLNCTGPDGTGGPTPEPCGVCPSCTAIAEERALDVIEMDAASQTGKTDVLELIEGAQFAPIAARYKVFILDEVHMLSEKAWNALLKTVEEPPPYVKFVFATTEARRVPITVLSRCQRFDLRRVEPEILTRHLVAVCAKEAVTAEAEALALLAAAAEGSVRDSLSLLDQAIALSDGPVTAATVREMLGLADRALLVELFEALLAGEPRMVIERFRAMWELGADPETVLADLLAIAHGLSRLRAGVPALELVGLLGAAQVKRLEALPATVELAGLARAWQMLLKGLEEVRAAPSALMAAEMVLLRVATAAPLPPPGELVRILRGEAAPPEPRPAAVPPRAEAVTAAPPQPRLALVAEPDDAIEDEPPPVTTAEALIERLRAHGETSLAALLHGGARILRFEPGRIELQPVAGMPADLPARLAAAARAATGQRWFVAIGSGPAGATLAEAERAAKEAELEALADAPEVQALFELFPGARLVDLRRPPRAAADQSVSRKDS